MYSNVEIHLHSTYINNKKEIGRTLLGLPVDIDSRNQRANILISKGIYDFKMSFY